MSLLVLCPSRGRPAAAQAVLASFLQTRADPDTRILFVTDDAHALERGYPIGQTWIEPAPSLMDAIFAVAADDEARGGASLVALIEDDYRFHPAFDRELAAEIDGARIFALR